MMQRAIDLFGTVGVFRFFRSLSMVLSDSAFILRITVFSESSIGMRATIRYVSMMSSGAVV